MEKLTCLKCGHGWTPRKEEKPLSCPNCKSRQWDSEYYQPCQICKRRFITLDVHHIDGNKQNNKSSNLIKLCKDCHSMVHARETSKKQNNHHRRIRDYQVVNQEVVDKLNELREMWLTNRK